MRRHGYASILSDRHGFDLGYRRFRDTSRDHNQHGLLVWMAGGWIKPDATYGETDDFSVRAAGEEIPLKDVHATLLHLMGLDQNQMSVLHAGPV